MRALDQLNSRMLRAHITNTIREFFCEAGGLGTDPTLEQTANYLEGYLTGLKQIGAVSKWVNEGNIFYVHTRYPDASGLPTTIKIHLTPTVNNSVGEEIL
jgi:hypothetical protein